MVISLVLIIVIGSAGVLELAARILQLKTLVGPPAPPRSPSGALQSVGAPAFVSVHVATYNEPPDLVIQTLQRLTASRFSDFEVVVIDNNTDDPGLWAPVAQAASALGSRFKFFHYERLGGAKAGALNQALTHTDMRATHIAIVDADYFVDPEFLADALHSLTENGVDYVQFPQAYRGVGRAARGVEQELGDYFTCFSRGAGRPGSMLPTGTLSLFTEAALRSVGGWPTETITEDAELGVRLQAAGFRGLWLARSRGRGLLPVDFAGLRKQRARWAAGNLQVLKRLPRFAWLDLKVHDLINLIVQLTAWISLLLPATFGLLVAGVAPTQPLARTISTLSAAIILASAALTSARMMMFSAQDVAWSVRLEAFATKTALTWTSATAWIPALLPRSLIFHRTPKAITAKQNREPVLAALSLAFLGIGVLYMQRGLGVETLACVLLASVWPCARVVDANLRGAAALNPELCA